MIENALVGVQKNMVISEGWRVRTLHIRPQRCNVQLIYLK